MYKYVSFFIDSIIKILKIIRKLDLKRNMKFCAILLLVSTFSAVLADEPKYTTKYDNIDLDEIIKSDRLLKNYVNCLLEKGKCTPDGAELKSKYCYYVFITFN